MTFPVACPKCGHEDAIDVEPSTTVVVCGECRTRVAYGQVCARWMTTPHDRVLKVHLSHPITGEAFEGVIDPLLAIAIVKDLLSVVKPPG